MEAGISPLDLEIVEGALESAMKEIEAQVERTARSTLIREQNDHVPAIYDARGRSIASVSFTANVDPILERWAPDDIAVGDVFLWNHPYRSNGGIGHLPDLCLTIPVFAEGRVVAYVQEMGHVTDVGGMVVGSMPQQATEVFQEGFLVPPVKLVGAGVRNDALFETILANSRFPDDLEGDIDALIGGCRVGVARIAWLCARYGVDVLERTFELLLDRTERTLLDEVLPRIPDGTYRFADFVEYCDIPTEPRDFIRIALVLEKTAGRIVFDFDGTDAQVRGAINFPADDRFYARGLATTFKSIVPDLVVNDGVLRVVGVRLPKGSVLSPEYPAACSYRHYPLLRAFGVALGALATALQGDVPQGADNMSGLSLSGGEPGTGRPWYVSMPMGGGGAGRPFADGSDAVYFTPGRNVPAEFTELRYPLDVVEFGLVPDSGGPGRYRGGMGFRLHLRFRADTQVRVRTDRRYLQPVGVKGGRAGASARFVLNPGGPSERALPGKSDAIAARAGDTLLVDCPGGGGWGDPLEREAELVELDVRRGLVTPAAARRDYAVVVGNAGATRALREDLRRDRGDLPLFDRGPRFAELAAAGALGDVRAAT